MSMIYQYIDIAMIGEYSVRRIIANILFVLHLFVLFTMSLGAIAYIICQVWTSRPSSRVVNLLEHIFAVVIMVDGFLTVVLLNERHSLSGSSSISLCIILIVAVSFVFVMGYEAWKRPDVPEHGRDNQSSFQIFESQITTENKTFTEAYAIKGNAEELWGPMILSVVLTPLIGILIFGNFESQTASDKGKNSLYIVAISFCFLSFILGVISMLLNSHPLKVHSELHREKVKNALGILNFIYTFLLIVTVVTIIACHLGEYALLNVIPLLGGLAWPHAKVDQMSDISKPKNWDIMALIVAVLAAIIRWGSTFYRDMSILFSSMGMVLYLSQKLATFTQPSIRGLEQEHEHLD